MASAVSALYAVWYFSAYRDALEEFDMAARGRLTAASTELGREAAEVMKAVRDSGAYDLKATAEFLLRIHKAYLDSLRRSAAVRALTAAAVYTVFAASIIMMNSLLAPLYGIKAGALAIHPPDIRLTLYVSALVTMAVAGRIFESWAAVPLFSPLTLALLFV